MMNPEIKLTDTQLVLLSTAAQRDDLLVTIPDRLKGSAARSVVSKLLALSLVEEVVVSRNEPAWRSNEEDQPIGLKLTRAGLEIIGIEIDDGTGVAAGEIPSESGPISASLVLPAGEREEPQPSAPRPGSKQALVVSLLQQKSGATLEELAVATGWLPHTTRAALTGLRRKGLAIAKAKREDGKTVYRINNAGPNADAGAGISHLQEA